VQVQEWDWSRTVVDHLDIDASDFSESVPMREVGALAAKLLLDRISGDATAPVGGRIHLPTMVVERGSVGPPRIDR
jgi:DNA-binding LacI/PurR family transcriptional regulator